MVVLISNGESFFDITELIPSMMKHGFTRQESIEELMELDNCNQCVEGDTFAEASKKLIK